MPSLTNVDIDDELDKEDCVRRVLAETVVPRSIPELVQIFRDYQQSGMLTLLPSKKKRLHCEFCDVPAVVESAVAAGWLHAITGKTTWQEIAEHTDGLKTTLSHDFPTDDGGRHNRVLDWAVGADRAAWDPKLDHYALTHAGFEALTGHKQGERPVHEPEDVDPADVQPAEIGAA